MDFPIKNCDFQIFSIAMLNYQRVHIRKNSYDEYVQTVAVHPSPFTSAPLPSAAIRRDSARRCAPRCVAPGGNWGRSFQLENDWTMWWHIMCETVRYMLEAILVKCHVYVYIYIYMCVCVSYRYSYIYIHTHIYIYILNTYTRLECIWG